MKFVRYGDNFEIIEVVTHYNPFIEPAKSAIPKEWKFVEVDDRFDNSWIYCQERETFIPPSMDWFYFNEKNKVDLWFASKMEELTAIDDVAFHPWEAAILHQDTFISLMHQRKERYDVVKAQFKDVNFEELLDAIAPKKDKTIYTLVEDTSLPST